MRLARLDTPDCRRPLFRRSCGSSWDSLPASLRPARSWGLRSFGLHTTPCFAVLVADKPEVSVLPAAARGAIESLLPRAPLEQVSASGKADVPVPYPDIKLPVREGEQLEVCENEGGAAAPVSSTRNSTWRSSRPAVTAYPILGAEPI